ncbi:MAG: Transcriptional regulator, partial [uncultured Rubellimicrobium sp.]
PPHRQAKDEPEPQRRGSRRRRRGPFRQRPPLRPRRSRPHPAL